MSEIKRGLIMKEAKLLRQERRGNSSIIDSRIQVSHVLLTYRADRNLFHHFVLSFSYGSKQT